MANPLQPKCIKYLKSIGAYVSVSISKSVTGDPDLLVCISGKFYGLEIKWKTDRPSEVQKSKINSIIDAGGRAYFITSLEELKYVLQYDVEPKKYKLKNKLSL